MKQWSGAIFVTAGLVVLIATLVAMIVSQQNKDDAMRRTVGDNILSIAPSNDVTEADKVELLATIPQAMEPIIEDSFIELTSLARGEVQIPTVTHPPVTQRQVDDFIGFLRYGTNVEENYNALVSSFPGYLKTNFDSLEVVDNDYVYIFSKWLTADARIWVLVGKVKPETHVFVTQLGKQENRVQQLCVLQGAFVTDVAVTKEFVVFNTKNATGKQGALLAVGAKNGSLAVLSRHLSNAPFLMFEEIDKVTVQSGENLYDVGLHGDGNIVLTSSEGERLVGTLYD